MPVHWPPPVSIPVSMDCTDAPESLICPITQTLMGSPALVTLRGCTYDRKGLVRWIREHGTDPIDRDLRLRVTDLAPNLAVRDMVEDFVREKYNPAVHGPMPAVEMEEEEEKEGRRKSGRRRRSLGSMPRWLPPLPPQIPSILSLPPSPSLFAFWTPCNFNCSSVPPQSPSSQRELLPVLA